MSATVFDQQNPSAIQTRRVPIRNDDAENSSQVRNNRRSLSGKFRSLFRKNSASPTRSVVQSEGRAPPAPIRQRSPSPATTRTATEAPHLRAPLIKWPFGKKKDRLNTTTTSEKPKRKEKGKTKKTSARTMEISAPTYQQQQQQQHQTSIRGQNFVPRTPELTHGATGRTQSSSSYDITTKGFRDYMILDSTKSSQQVNLPDLDVNTPPPYISDRSRSPSLNHQSFPDTSIERSYYRNTATPIADIEIIPIPRQQQEYTVGEKSPLRSTQTLIQSIPLLHSTIAQPTTVTNNSDRWRSTSDSSLNHTELRSNTATSMDINVPKFNAPIVPSSSISSKKEFKQVNSQSRNDDAYNSLSAINDFGQSTRSNANMYTSLPDTHTIENGGFTPIKPTKSTLNKYPTLSAIVEHHVRPISSTQFNERSSPSRKSPQRTARFDTSTTTLNGYDEQQRFTIITNGSSSSLSHDDGFIRPITPPKSSIQHNGSTSRVDSSNQSSHHNSTESSIIYRSSAVIYTRDKHNYGDGGEIRTWSMQGNNDHDHHGNLSTSIQILPSRIINEYQYHIGLNDEDNSYDSERLHQQYSLHRYPDNTNHSNLTRSSTTDEREQIFDQSTRSYKVTDHTQESRNSKTSEVTLRHYTLKRTNSYDGLGILISADVDTRLNHRIRDIETDSPGSRVGLRINDRIINVNGINVEKTDFNDVLLLIKDGLINNNLQFSVTNESI